WDSKNVLVALSLDKTDKKAQMMDIWTQRSDCMLPIKTLDDFNFENNNADIMWKKRNAESTGSLSFMTGNIISDFSFPNNRLRLPEEVKVRRLPESNILNVYCQADLSPLFEKYKHNLVRYNIPADTLKKYYGGYL